MISPPPIAWTEPLTVADRLCAWDRQQRPAAWAHTAPSVDEQDMSRLILTLALARAAHLYCLALVQVPLGALLLTRWAAVGLDNQPIPPGYRALWRAFHNDTERILRFADLQEHVNAIVLDHLTDTEHTTPPTAITVGQRLQQLDTHR